MKYLLFITTVFFYSCSNSQTTDFNTKNGVAIEGYDPVSYFSDKPVKGKKTITETVDGVTFQFASNKNRTKFKGNTEKYVPVYGGWCAYAMGETGEKVTVDPKTYKIIEGRVYLFYNAWGNNTLNSWNDNEEELKEKADKNWSQLNK